MERTAEVMKLHTPAKPPKVGRTASPPTHPPLLGSVAATLSSAVTLSVSPPLSARSCCLVCVQVHRSTAIDWTLLDQASAAEYELEQARLKLATLPFGRLG